jgi:type IV secretion system protein VirB4
MMNLAEYRRTATRLADYLPWAALVAEGVVLNKDGSFQRTARFAALIWTRRRGRTGRRRRALNNAFRRLGSGWAIFVEAQRHEARPIRQTFSDAPRRWSMPSARPISRKPARISCPAISSPSLSAAGRGRRAPKPGSMRAANVPASIREVLRGFIDRTDRVLALLDGFMPECRWLDDSETLTYLHSTVSTNRHRVRVPETPIYLDALLADQPLTGGLEPRPGGASARPHHRRFPTATTPGLLDDLNRLAFPIAGRRAPSCSTRPTRPSC